MEFLDEHQDIVDVYLNLLHEVHFKLDIVIDVLFLSACFRPKLIMEVIVPRDVVLHLTFGQEMHFRSKVIEGAQEVPELQDGSELPDKSLLVLIADHIRKSLYRIFLYQSFNQLLVSMMVLALSIHIAIVVILERPQEDDAACIFISEQGKAVICRLLKVSETDDISAVFYSIEDSIGTAVGLKKTM